MSLKKCNLGSKKKCNLGSNPEKPLLSISLDLARLCGDSYNIYCKKLDKSVLVDNKVLVYYTMRTEKSQESCCTPLANFVQLRYNMNK